MAVVTEQRLGYGFGMLGGLLLALGGLVSIGFGAADFILGRPTGALSALSEAVVLFVVGALAIFFARLGYREWNSRPIASGILLVVVAFLGWVVLGLGTDVLALLGALFVFLAGVLYMIEPAKKAVGVVVSAA